MYLLRMKTWINRGLKEEREKSKHEYLHLRIPSENRI